MLVARCWPLFQARHGLEHAGKIDYGVASIDALYSAIYVTLKQGYFATEGLDVSYINSQSGPRSKRDAGGGPVVHHHDRRQ